MCNFPVAVYEIITLVDHLLLVSIYDTKSNKPNALECEARAQQLLRWATVPEQSGPKCGEWAAVLVSVGELDPHLSASPGPRPTSVPGGILIRSCLTVALSAAEP